MILASCACGSDEVDGQPTSPVVDDEEGAGGTTDDDTDANGSDPDVQPDDVGEDDASDPVTTEEQRPDDVQRDDRYDGIREFTRGNLRSSYGDNQSDCGTRFGEPLTMSLAEPANGADLVLLCLWSAGPPTGSFRLTDPAGRSWADTPISVGQETTELVYTFSSANDGNLTEPVVASTVEVVESGRSLPVGWTFARGDEQLTTIYLLLPSGRPSGTWTANIAGNTTSADVATCTPETTDRTAPWITGPIDFLVDPITGDPTIDNCRLAPSAVGLSVSEAISLLGSQATEFTLRYQCAPQDTAFVVDQHFPAAGQLRGDSSSLVIAGPCPPIIDVRGMSVGSAADALRSSWPDDPGGPDITSRCAPDAVVSRTLPSSGEAPASLSRIEILCESTDVVAPTAPGTPTTTTKP